MAWVTLKGNKVCVIVNREAGPHYDGIVTTGGGKIIFDSSDRLHYLAFKGNKIYLVEKKME
ncbi:MAG TPA: hypothetical protein VF398_08660 [bacterium]